MEDDTQQYDKFLLVWDMYGLEAAVNMDEIFEAEVEAKLKEEQSGEKIGQLINYFLLRARFNTQRNYEIYAVNLPSGTTKDEVFGWFNGNEQSMAELIRIKGVPILKHHGSVPIITK